MSKKESGLLDVFFMAGVFDPFKIHHKVEIPDLLE